MPLPPKIQFPILMNTLSYDRALVNQGMSQYIVGIVYQSSNRISQWTKDELLRLTTDDPEYADFAGRIRWVPIDMAEVSDLAGVLTGEHIRILYIAPLRAVSLSDIVKITRETRVLTICGVPEYVKKGVSVGTGQKGDRPEILINLSGSKAEGALFDSRLLHLAKVFDDEDDGE
jgi:hypothetical protein